MKRMLIVTALAVGVTLLMGRRADAWISFGNGVNWNFGVGVGGGPFDRCLFRRPPPPVYTTDAPAYVGDDFGHGPYATPAGAPGAPIMPIQRGGTYDGSEPYGQSFPLGSPEGPLNRLGQLITGQQPFGQPQGFPYANTDQMQPYGTVGDPNAVPGNYATPDYWHNR